MNRAHDPRGSFALPGTWAIVPPDDYCRLRRLSVPATRYFREFSFVEVQETHVSLPGPGTIRRWRREALDGFRFALLGPREVGQEGFRDGKVIETALKSIEAIAEELEARTAVFVTPAGVHPHQGQQERGEGVPPGREIPLRPRGVRALRRLGRRRVRRPDQGRRRHRGARSAHRRPLQAACRLLPPPRAGLATSRATRIRRSSASARSPAARSTPTRRTCSPTWTCSPTPSASRRP